jgi:hypothetical protein
MRRASHIWSSLHGGSRHVIGTQTGPLPLYFVLRAPARLRAARHSGLFLRRSFFGDLLAPRALSASGRRSRQEASIDGREFASTVSDPSSGSGPQVWS